MINFIEPFRPLDQVWDGRTVHWLDKLGLPFREEIHLALIGGPLLPAQPKVTTTDGLDLEKQCSRRKGRRL